MSIAIYDEDAMYLTQGVQEHEAHDMAQAIANDRGEPVWYGEDSENVPWEALTRVDPEELDE